MALAKPKALAPGATIGICAPAGPVDPEALRRGCDLLTAWGYRVSLAPHVEAQRGYLAGEDSARASDLMGLFADPRIDGILCARGGYGTMRLLPLLDWSVLQANPKWFGGYSDITALHQAFLRELGLVTFHCPTAELHRPMADYNQFWLRQALTSTDPLGELAGGVTLVGGTGRGPLVGGNLSLLVSLLGTPWELQSDGCLLLLEDVDEAPYRIDRMLMQLRLAGKLAAVTGVIFGDSPSCEQGPPGKPSLSLVEVLADHLGGLGVPVVYGLPFGHTRLKASLPLGVLARLDGDRGALVIEEAACR